jgi:hypothetical protein
MLKKLVGRSPRYLLYVLPIGGLIGWPLSVSKVVIEGLYFGIIVGMVVGAIVGLITGLSRGGSVVIKHYALRLTLWRSGDMCAKLILLKKVGGGYIFMHRMLLEYFADLPKTEKSGKAKRRVETDGASQWFYLVYAPNRSDTLRLHRANCGGMVSKTEIQAR